jgi:F-type H+-transporting ATPase subunit b
MTLDRLRQVSAMSGFVAAPMLCAAPARAEGALNLAPDPAVLVPLLILFAILVPLLNAVLFRPILSTLEARAARIEGARKRAESLGREVEQTLAQYSEAVRIARTQADQERKQQLVAAQRESSDTTVRERTAAESTIDRARQEIAAALVGARAQLEAEAQTLAREAASRVLGRAL